MPHQLSVFAENRPGKLDRLTSVLAENDINIKAITISDLGDYGIIKLLVNKPDDGCQVLKDKGIAVTLKDIVAVKIEDTPGSLHEVLSVLAQNDINVEDAYGFSIKNEDKAVFVFQVENVPGTEKVLKDKGFLILTDNELYLL